MVVIDAGHEGFINLTDMKNSKTACVLLCGLLTEEVAAFAPQTRRPMMPFNSQQMTTTAVQNALLTYEADWHASLHPLDDLGVEMDDVLSLNSSPLGVRWYGSSSVAANNASAKESADGGLAEVATAFLPVAVLLLLEITYSLSNQA